MSAQRNKGEEERIRQEYEKPQVSSEEVFETLALTCSKAVNQQGCELTGGTPVGRS